MGVTNKKRKVTKRKRIITFSNKKR